MTDSGSRLPPPLRTRSSRPGNRWSALLLRGAPVALLGCYAVLLMLIPAQLTFGSLGSVGSPAGLLGLLALVLWASGRGLRSKSERAADQPVLWTLAFFYASLLASYAVANRRILTADETSGADRQLLIFLAYFGVALLAADALDRAQIDRLISALVFLGAGIAAVGILQFFTGVNIVGYYSVLPGLTENTEFTEIAQRSLFRRVNGTTSHPIEFSVTLCMVLPLALHRAYCEGVKHRARQWIPVTLIAVAIPMTVSRSGTLALVVVAVVMAAGWRAQQVRRALLIAPLFLIVMRLAIPGLLGTIKSLFTNIGNDPSISGRTEDYAVVREYISSAPWFGRGFGTFIPTQYQLLDNQYLGSLIETGVVGLAALLLLFLVGIGVARGARLRARDARTRDLGQALTASLCVPAVSFVTFDGFGFPIITGLTFLIFGCAGALWRCTGGATPAASWSSRLLDGSGPRRLPASPRRSRRNAASRPTTP